MALNYTPEEIQVFSDFPKQVDSPNNHMKWFGCYWHCLCLVANTEVQIKQTPASLVPYFNFCVEKGYVLDNNVPVQKGQPWERADIVSPESVVREYANFYGVPGLTELKYVYRGPMTLPPEGATLAIEEMRTHIGDTQGSHFRVCSVDDSSVASIVYDPYPGLAVFELVSIRYWSYVHKYPGQDLA